MTTVDNAFADAKAQTERALDAVEDGTLPDDEAAAVGDSLDSLADAVSGASVGDLLRAADFDDVPSEVSPSSVLPTMIDADRESILTLHHLLELVDLGESWADIDGKRRAERLERVAGGDAFGAESTSLGKLLTSVWSAVESATEADDERAGEDSAEADAVEAEEASDVESAAETDDSDEIDESEVTDDSDDSDEAAESDEPAETEKTDESDESPDSLDDTIEQIRAVLGSSDKSADASAETDDDIAESAEASESDESPADDDGTPGVDEPGGVAGKLVQAAADAISESSEQETADAESDEAEEEGLFETLRDDDADTDDAGDTDDTSTRSGHSSRRRISTMPKKRSDMNTPRRFSTMPRRRKWRKSGGGESKSNE